MIRESYLFGRRNQNYVRVRIKASRRCSWWWKTDKKNSIDTFLLKQKIGQVKIACCPLLEVSSRGDVWQNNGGVVGRYKQVGEYNGHPHYQVHHDIVDQLHDQRTVVSITVCDPRAAIWRATFSTGRRGQVQTAGSSRPSWTRPCSWWPPGTRYTSHGIISKIEIEASRKYKSIIVEWKEYCHTAW